LGVPLIVSTGMGTPEEVGKALEATGAAPSTVLLHCVSAYPAPAVEANLRAIPAMAAQFRVQVGWSDHTLGAAASIAAVALGATLLEKHITTDKSRKGPDHAASLSPEEAHAYVAAIRATSQSLGDGLKRRMPSEEENARLVRRSLHAARPIAAGSIIVEPDLVILRPEGGLAPSELVVGATAARDISAGSPIIADDLQRDA
jgi:N,N'-diacetyllegionaminate synthase